MTRNVSCIRESTQTFLFVLLTFDLEGHNSLMLDESVAWNEHLSMGARDFDHRYKIASVYVILHGADMNCGQ
jgi:hypothetical protein